MDNRLTQIPKKLFKFQSVSNLSIENLKQSKIWFSKKDKLNDPFDLSISVNFGNKESDYQELCDYYTTKTGHEMEKKFLTDGKINKKFVSHTKKISKSEIQKKINNEFSQLGVACFSEMPNDFPEDILMWSHYADGHRGFCLEFDTSYKPFLEVQKIHQVIYSSSYPYFSIAAVIKTANFLITPLITKSKRWKYECEWRLIIDKVLVKPEK